MEVNLLEPPEVEASSDAAKEWGAYSGAWGLVLLIVAVMSGLVAWVVSNSKDVPLVGKIANLADSGGGDPNVKGVDQNGAVHL